MKLNVSILIFMTFISYYSSQSIIYTSPSSFSPFNSLLSDRTEKNIQTGLIMSPNIIVSSYNLYSMKKQKGENYEFGLYAGATTIIVSTFLKNKETNSKMYYTNIALSFGSIISSAINYRIYCKNKKNQKTNLWENY